MAGSRITIGCKVCGTTIVTTDLAEATAWNGGHDGRCPGPDPRAKADTLPVIELHTGAVVQDIDGDRWTRMDGGGWRVMPAAQHEGDDWTLDAVLDSSAGRVTVIEQGLAD